ncbi:MAG: hypothetical protein AAF802_22760 [Planctomycetota bacterium]
MSAPITETEIREATRRRLKKTFASSPTLIVDELGVDHHTARVDLAVVNCALHAYEIKSDFDKLDRLAESL